MLELLQRDSRVMCPSSTTLTLKVPVTAIDALRYFETG